MTEFLQLLFEGVSVGSTYALIALGFTIVFRASHIVNFAQGALLLCGGYLVSWLAVAQGVPFASAILIALVVLSLAGAAFQAGVLSRVTDQPALVLVMVTIGLAITLEGLIEALFGAAPRQLGDPWGSQAVEVGGIVLNEVKLWGIGCATVALACFFAFDRRTRYGLAMRATASDNEAADVLGVPVNRVYAMSWAMAGTAGVLGGVFLAGFPNSPNLALGNAALLAFPAIILGGLGSPVGAVVGGVFIGVAEVMTSGYGPDALGQDFAQVSPYLAMVLILLVRPYGLFGHVPAERL